MHFRVFFTDPPTTEIYTFPYTTLFRSGEHGAEHRDADRAAERPEEGHHAAGRADVGDVHGVLHDQHEVLQNTVDRSEEHTSELQSHVNLVCRLLLEKKKVKKTRLRTLI